jgi:chaperonin GroEL
MAVERHAGRALPMTTEAMIADRPKKDAAPAMPGGGMGDMGDMDF